MDSTKKITKKLRGYSAGTASWATNVGNEHGQVLISVLTTNEGGGISDMLLGLQLRYDTAGVPPPQLFYVDRDCCSRKIHLMLQPHWTSTAIRLDIWHFMRRIATAVITEVHPLYAGFMSRLSRAIFAWDEGDFSKLLEARRAQLQEEGFLHPSDADVLKRIMRRDLALHCKRITRGVEETKRLVRELLEVYTSEQGKDTLGVPLLNNERAWQTWKEQERHLPCIQDPPGISLYTQTGTVTKGGICLPTYRCARGSTSLENFHLHMNRFIPGDSTNDVHYQAYLVEGLARWNQDRASAALEGGRGQPRTYSGKLKQVISKLSTDVLGKNMLPLFKAPRAYTGEKMGYEYLLSQNAESILDKLDPVLRQDMDLTAEMEGE
ncbi:uncharacterized protein LOC143293387 isoform X2 [Babylonia areolata]|uniref:uncharacterized protein LOC143293387 isoform X2 n=1 Tax=Babylonia areolata TaxID=304850 RepID=UPI003FD3FB7A